MSSNRNFLPASAAALGLTLTGLVSPAMAGAIDMDFTTMTPATATGSGLTAGPLGVDLAPFGFAGSTLNITGSRSALPDQYDANNKTGNDDKDMRTGEIRLSMNGNGLGVCSDLQTTYNSGGGKDPGTVCGDDETGPNKNGDQVDGKELDETLSFVIAPGLEFAVNTVTFGYVNPDDAVTMYYGKGGSLSVDFKISNTDYAVCVEASVGDPMHPEAVCTVDIYKMIALEDGVGGLVWDPLIDYDAGLDDIFAYLASEDGFKFQAGVLNSNSGQDDDWFIRGAKWVAADKVPEPASMTLLGAGIMGLGWLNRRRTRLR